MHLPRVDAPDTIAVLSENEEASTAAFQYGGFLDSFLRRMLRSLLVIFFEQISFSSNPVTAPTTTQLRKTALNSAHRRMGAKMVDFGGWDMPVEYTGLVSEHLATRHGRGPF